MILFKKDIIIFIIFTIALITLIIPAGKLNFWSIFPRIIILLGYLSYMIPQYFIVTKNTEIFIIKSISENNEETNEA